MGIFCMTRQIVLCAFILFPIFLLGAPYAYEGFPIEFTQPNKTQLNLRVFGDEFYAVTRTIDDYTVVNDSSLNAYCYAQFNADQTQLISSGKIVGVDTPLSSAYLLDLSEACQNEIRLNNFKGLNPSLPEHLKASQRLTRSAINASNIKREHGLTFLVRFPDDDPENVPFDQNLLDTLLNKKGHIGRNTGSVRDYFLGQSHGKLDVTSFVTPWLTLPNPRNYYNFEDWQADNPKTLRTLQDAGRLLIEDAAKSFEKIGAPGWDASSFSTSPNGCVNVLNLLFTGGTSGVWAKGLWPNKGQNNNIPIIKDNIRYYTYQITNIEFDTGDIWKKEPPLGTIIHECGHMICGFPDFYDKQGSSRGLGEYCLMAYGHQLDGGYSPSDINAYLKVSQNWVTPIIVDENDYITDFPLSYNDGTVLKYINPNSNQATPEYFLAEYRSQDGLWSSKIPSKGVLIWHIDEPFVNFPVSNVMEPNYHGLVHLVQADNQFDLELGQNAGNVNDAFSLNTNNNAYDDTTSPHAKWWNGSNSKFKLSLIGNNTQETITLSVGYAPPGEIIIESPNEVTEVIMGEALNLKWNSTFSGNLKIELFNGSGFVQTITSSIPVSTGQFSWTPSYQFNTQRKDYYFLLTALDEARIFKKSRTFEIIREYTDYVQKEIQSQDETAYTYTLQIDDDYIVDDVDFRINMSSTKLLRLSTYLYLGGPQSTVYNAPYSVPFTNGKTYSFLPSTINSMSAFDNLVFDDQSTVEAGGNPYPKYVRPFYFSDATNKLTGFNGESSKGTWKLFFKSKAVAKSAISIKNWGVRLKFKMPWVSIHSQASVNMGDSLVLPLTMNMASSNAIDIPFKVEGSAQYNTHFQFQGVKSFDAKTGMGMIPVPASKTRVDLTLLTVKNSERIGDKNFKITLDYPDSAYRSETEFQQLITLVDPVTQPTLAFNLSQTIDSRNYGRASIELPIELSNASQEVVSVDYTISGDAVNGVHYQLEQSGFVFGQGDTEKIIVLQLLDSDEKTPKTIVIELFNLINASSGDSIRYTLNLLPQQDQPPWHGTGQSHDPYQIKTVADLTYMAEKVNAGHSFNGVFFVLMNDLDLGGQTEQQWTPIGTNHTPFDGCFDGNNQKIINLFIKNPQAQYVGLFGYIASGARIKNLGVENMNITVSKDDITVGGMIAENQGEVEKCYVVGDVTVSGENNCVGGFVGRNLGTVSNCFGSCRIKTP